MINQAELRVLEATLLPSLERHHLRLLAHGLRTLQAVRRPRRSELPNRAALEQWALAEPTIADDKSFREAFINQLLAVGAQLQQIAAGSGRGPLDLDLDDLVLWARNQADQRLSDSTEASPPPG